MEPSSLLIVFHNGDQSARQSQTRTVQRVNESRLAFIIAIFDVGASPLKIRVIGNRRNLQPLAASRRPDFDIIRHGCAKADIAGAKLFDAMS